LFVKNRQFLQGTCWKRLSVTNRFSSRANFQPDATVNPIIALMKMKQIGIKNRT